MALRSIIFMRGKPGTEPHRGPLAAALAELGRAGQAAPWARSSKNIKKPQRQMYGSCRKA
jgi:hypothetical protein